MEAKPFWGARGGLDTRDRFLQFEMSCMILLLSGLDALSLSFGEEDH